MKMSVLKNNIFKGNAKLIKSNMLPDLKTNA